MMFRRYGFRLFPPGRSQYWQISYFSHFVTEVVRYAYKAISREAIPKKRGNYASISIHCKPRDFPSTSNDQSN